MHLPRGLRDLLRRPSTCDVVTTMPDGSPQITWTRVDTDGYYSVRRYVVDVTAQGGARRIERLAQRYLGTPYP